MVPGSVPETSISPTRVTLTLPLGVWVVEPPFTDTGTPASTSAGAPAPTSISPSAISTCVALGRTVRLPRGGAAAADTAREHEIDRTSAALMVDGMVNLSAQEPTRSPPPLGAAGRIG